MIRLAALFWCLAAPALAQTGCRQALALGLDVSGSVDAREYRLQLDGLAAALNSAPVREVLLAPSNAPVRIAIFEWSGPHDQYLILPWREITDEAALIDVIATLASTTRRPAQPTTALGPAILTGLGLLEQQPTCWKRTLDMSGDGKANTGTRPQDIPDGAIPSDVTINGLVIGHDDPGHDLQISELSAYYQNYVVRGPQAFVETALGFEDYAAAMTRKLLRELASFAIGSATP
ncbi:DUF1194 domain-containing protein [Octadecabacter sp. R77987]|uniref:DUF1194 domain-containing protein n=1 Tax=Octadecabacter sp. R77987 TaxID=3093874 RepID=UPI00366AB32B